MDVLVDNFDTILLGFWLTVRLLVVSGLLALVLGVIIAALRVAPVEAMRAVGTSYVTMIRNTPLLIMFLFMTQGVPVIINLSFFTLAVAALGLYTAAFVGEAVRSGINAVHVGQAEAARAVGMTFGQTLRLIILPQAIRSVIPPLASILIALTKNTSLVSVFGLVDATGVLDNLGRDNPGALIPLFLGISAGYIMIVAVIASTAQVLERKLVVLR